MTSLRHVEGIDDTSRVLEAMTGQLSDRLKHFHQVRLNWTKYESLGELGSIWAKRTDLIIVLDAIYGLRRYRDF